MSSVYLETSFFSECCTIRTGEIARGRRATSLQWWHHDARRFDLHISAEVVRELSSPDFPEQVRAPALEMLAGLPQLALTEDVLGVAAVLVRERVMPGPAGEGTPCTSPPRSSTGWITSSRGISSTWLTRTSGPTFRWCVPGWDICSPK